MLILRRKSGESIVVGEEINLTVLDINEGSVRLAIDAPKNVPILRSELLQAAAANRESAEAALQPDSAAAASALPSSEESKVQDDNKETVSSKTPSDGTEKSQQILNLLTRTRSGGIIDRSQLRAVRPTLMTAKRVKSAKQQTDSSNTAPESAQRADTNNAQTSIPTPNAEKSRKTDSESKAAAAHNRKVRRQMPHPRTKTRRSEAQKAASDSDTDRNENAEK